MGRLLSRVGVGLLVGCTACADYSGLAFEADGPVPEGAAVESDRIALPVGATLRIFARPQSRTAVVYEDSASLELISVDPDIAATFPDAVDPWRWVLVARGGGETCLDVVVEETLEDCLLVTVTGGAQ